MLKIKDNVDLKELEKFGFLNTSDYIWETPIFTRDLVGVAFEQWSDGKWILYLDIRHERVTNSDLSKKMNLIFDLIEAGLVEKVSD